MRDGSVESNGREMLGFAPGTNALVTAETGNGRVTVIGVPSNASTDATSGNDASDASSRTVRFGTGVHSAGQFVGEEPFYVGGNRRVDGP